MLVLVFASSSFLILQVKWLKLRWLKLRYLKGLHLTLRPNCNSAHTEASRKTRDLLLTTEMYLLSLLVLGSEKTSMEARNGNIYKALILLDFQYPEHCFRKTVLHDQGRKGKISYH